MAAVREVTLEDLMRILRECAGGEENVQLGGEVLDMEFDALGYDSLALLETVARITREYGIRIEDDSLEAPTPRVFLELINDV